MVEPAADVVGKIGVTDHLSPVEQQVVIIEYILLLLGFDKGREQVASAPLPNPSTTETTCRAPRSSGISALTQRE